MHCAITRVTRLADRTVASDEWRNHIARAGTPCGGKLRIACWTAAADVTSVVTAVGSVIGTLVEAFFGIETGSAGRKDAEKKATDAQHRLAKLALLHDPGDAAARALLEVM